MFQENELVNLFSGVAAAIVLVFMARKMESVYRLRFFYAAFVAMLVVYFATILEGFFGADFFNLLEHSALAVAAGFFAFACWRMRHAARKGQGD